MRLLRGKPTRRAAALIVLATVAGLAPQSVRRARWDFQGDEPGRVAKGFTGVVGRWEVAGDADNQVLVQRAENQRHVFNLTLIDTTSYRDVELSVRMKAMAGENDRGGGLVWRAKDGDNYYACRYDPLKPNFRVYKVEHGKCTQLDHAAAPGDAEWHTLRITMIGREIVGYLDGKPLLEAEDSTFLDVGRIGLWSESDARTYFDDLEVAGK